MVIDVDSLNVSHLRTILNIRIGSPREAARFLLMQINATLQSPKRFSLTSPDNSPSENSRVIIDQFSSIPNSDRFPI